MILEDNLRDINVIKAIIDEPMVVADIITMLCGKHLGDGVYRTVYEYNPDPRYVIKLERPASFCNLSEHMIWDEVEGLIGDLAWVKKWFAPCKWISPNGRVLVMQKTYQKSIDVPKKVPEFLWDAKPDNFGWIGSNYVCHDYGQIYNMMHYSKKMRNINW